MTREINVTIWSDIGCPWATLALHTLHDAAARSAVRLDITHRNFPLELFNGVPTPKGLLDIEMAGIGGLRPDLAWRPWAAADATYPVTTLPAMAAVRATTISQGNAAADQLDTALRAALFVESRCISLNPVILEVAGECPLLNAETLATDLAAGAGVADVYADWRAAQELNVQGSPQLEVADQVLVNPGVGEMTWSLGSGEGFLRVDSYDPGWAVTLVDESK